MKNSLKMETSFSFVSNYENGRELGTHTLEDVERFFGILPVSSEKS